VSGPCLALIQNWSTTKVNMANRSLTYLQGDCLAPFLDASRFPLEGGCKLKRVPVLEFDADFAQSLTVDSARPYRSYQAILYAACPALRQNGHTRTASIHT
jgi:hypothetical protein